MKDFLNIISEFLSFDLKLLEIPLLITVLVWLFSWLLGAAGICKMSKEIGYKNSWVSFILPLYPFALGRAANTYKKKNGGKSADFSLLLELLLIAVALLYGVLLILGVNAVNEIIQNARICIENNSAMTPAMFSSAIPVIAVYFVALAITVYYKIAYYIALWRIFACYSNKTALFTVLSVFFGFLAPIFIFSLRKKQNKFKDLEQSSAFEF